MEVLPWRLSSSCSSSARTIACWRLQFSAKLQLPSNIQLSYSTRLRPTSLCVSALDRDLRNVLELASDAELHELSNILYGRSLLSPLIKSVTRGDGSHRRSEQELEGRDALVDRLESRFLYLGADAKETLRGNFELSLQSPWKYQHIGNAGKVDHMNQFSESWHVAFKLGGGELLKVLLKGGSFFSLSFLKKKVANKLGGRILLEAARYRVAKEVLRKAAASNLQAQVAMLTARQGLAGAASCYATLQRTTMLFAPVMWGTFAAEVVIKSLGTDYARVVKAIYAFAQIRLLRTYGWTRAEQSRPA